MSSMVWKKMRRITAGFVSAIFLVTAVPITSFADEGISDLLDYVEPSAENVLPDPILDSNPAEESGTDPKKDASFVEE